MGARLDQHFLVDEHVRDAIVGAVAIEPGDFVLEIGPGRGMLTGALLKRAREVVAVEMDERLAGSLTATLGSPPHLRVICADFLKLKLSSLEPGPWKIAANLPYAVATPILQRLLPWPHWRTATLMFQKEVAERIVARPGNGDYGLLTLSTLIYAASEIVLDVPRESFAPRPKVASAVVRLTRRLESLVPAGEQKMFFRVARAAFGQRRKMALGLLSKSLGLPRERVAEAFAVGGILSASRAEEISWEQFRGLAQSLF